MRKPLPEHLIQPRKSAETVAGRLRLAIVNGDLVKGEVLPGERDLIESFGVSRAIMREALGILETEGLLEVAPATKGGARIVGPTLALAAHAVGMVLQAQGTRLADVQIARRIIEPPAARMVAERQAPEAISRLTQALDAERTALDTPEFPFNAMRFHETLVQVSGNHTLSMFLFVLHEIHEGVALALSREPPDEDVRARTLDYHQQLIELVEAGDGDGAETLWRDYWDWITPFSQPGEAVVDVLQHLGPSNV